MPKHHTPGPWWVDDDGYIGAGSGDDYVTLAEILGANDEVEVIRANVALITAAPELLDALQEILPIVEYLAPEKFDDAAHQEAFEATLARARAAIEKAKGE